MNYKKYTEEYIDELDLSDSQMSDLFEKAFDDLVDKVSETEDIVSISNNIIYLEDNIMIEDDEEDGGIAYVIYSDDKSNFHYMQELGNLLKKNFRITIIS